MRPDRCTFDQYEEWLKREFAHITPPVGSSVVHSPIEAVNDPLPPWTFRFALIYPDQYYVQIFEHYRCLSKGEGGGGQLQILSYHYGPCGPERDEDGFPTKEDDCVLRIDINPNQPVPRHAHYDGHDHIPEERLPRLDFNSLTPSAFIRAVETHRETSRPMHKILGFEVQAAK